MKKIFIALLFAAIWSVNTNAQNGDGCHVYIVDVAMVEKANKSGANCKDESKCGVTTFPEFKPTVGEEELTTKTYKFPNGNLVVTANVFYTDESLSSAKGADSILLSITLARVTLKDVLSDENSAVAEFSLGNDPDAMRVKRFYKISGKSYLVGLECHFKKLVRN